jgi:hypothetical protein
MYRSPVEEAPLADDPVPDAEEPLLLEPVLDPEPLVPALLPPDIEDAAPLPILAFVRTNCVPAPDVLDPEPLVAEPDVEDPVAEPLPDVPVPDVPAVPAMSAVCRQPVTVTCCCVLELGLCWLLLLEPVEPDCALSVPASAIERTVPNTTLRFIYTS